MINNEYNHQIIQSLQQVQQQLEQQQPTQKDTKRTEHCTEDFQNKLLNKNIISDRECNRLIIPYSRLKIRLSIHCPSQGWFVIPNRPYNPQWLYVKKKTYDNYYADIYVGYNPFTLQPEGFSMRDRLVLMECKPWVWVYGIQRIELDNNIDTLFDLDKLRQLWLSNIKYV